MSARNHTFVVWLMVFVVLAVVGAAIFAVLRRRNRDPDGLTWRASPAEPWGSIALVVFFLFPVAAWIGRVLGSISLLPVLLLVAVVVLAWVRLGGRDHLRSLRVLPEKIEWSTLRGRGSADLADVVAVTDPSQTGQQPQVFINDGTVLGLPLDDDLLRVAANLADRIGQPWQPGNR